MKYKFDVDLDNKNDPRTLAFDRIASGSAVLDVGCACGDFATVLKKYKNCDIYGMEYDIESIETAKQTGAFTKIDRVDLNNFNEAEYDGYKNKFDFIIYTDVLEHLLYPQNVLKIFKKFLAKDGRFILSIPNIAHGSIKANLLLDRWDYTDLGLLDRTHLRFFTYKTIPSFLGDINLGIDKFWPTWFPPTGTQPNDPYPNLPPEIVKFIQGDVHAHIGQYVMECSARTADSDIILNNMAILDLNIEDFRDIVNKYSYINPRNKVYVLKYIMNFIFEKLSYGKNKERFKEKKEKYKKKLDSSRR
ncbi:hypothetical protein FACS1894205_1860 [Alphaproteobacteria bacterium]|nr:hypothetical protein FACS1894205_1860 [Alphaproteobacteria bacterium]